MNGAIAAKETALALCAKTGIADMAPDLGISSFSDMGTLLMLEILVPITLCEGAFGEFTSAFLGSLAEIVVVSIAAGIILSAVLESFSVTNGVARVAHALGGRAIMAVGILIFALAFLPWGLDFAPFVGTESACLPDGGL